MDWGKVDQFAQAMKAGNWNWNTVDKIIIDKNGAIMSGHHRIMAAMKAGIEIPKEAFYYYQGVTPRPVYDWLDILPKGLW